jgi:hypothetical protein
MFPVRTRAALAMLPLVAIAAISCGDDDDPNDPSLEQFTVTLNGAAERPDPVPTSATGSATLSFTGSGPITYSVTVNDLSSLPSMAHIHGPAGLEAANDVIVGLTTIASVLTGTLVSGTLTATNDVTISLDSLKVLMRNGNAYINVHTVNFPPGEIRGQINRQ